MSAPGTPTRLLIVDDNEAGRYAKSRLLRREGYEVHEAGTGKKTLEMVSDLRPALVLLDVKLPDANGIDLCGIIKNNHPGTLVLQLSASFVGQEDRIRGLDAGADSYLAEPVEPMEMLAVVRALLRLQTAEQDLRDANELLEERVANRTRELAETNKRLQEEITERQKAESALVQGQKMEAIGRLTGGIAHDFNNLLTAIVGNLDLIRSRVTDERIAKWAERAHQGAMRGAKLTAQLLAFSREQRLTVKPLDVNALVVGMDDLIDRSIGKEISVRLNLAPGPLLAMCDETQLELAILNLVINARDAMEGREGAITISSEVTSAAPGDPELRPGQYALLSVTDTGTGMPPEVMARALDPFYTTKPAGKGTGLGLSQVYGIARQCKGTVRMTSVQGHGTTIRIYLPVASELHPHIVAAPTREPASATILVVDDEAEVRAVLAESLAEYGYSVAQADSAASALDALDAVKPDLVVIDYAMPDRTGADLARDIRKILPLPIIFMSGYADVNALGDALGSAPLLRKPFDINELATMVSETLAAAKPESQ